MSPSIQYNKIVGHQRTNFMHTLLLLGSMAVILGMLGLSFAGVNGVIWACIAGLLVVFFTPRIPHSLILKMYRARSLALLEAPRLYQILKELTLRANLKAPPKLYYIPSQMMNAFAVGTRENAAIGITDGLLRQLGLRELSGILAHEMSHIRSNDMRVMSIADMISRMTSFFVSLGLFLLLLNFPLLILGTVTISWSGIVLLLAAPMLSSLLQMALSRTREFNADLDAARLTGDPRGLASALEKMESYQGNILEKILMPGHRIPEPSILRTHPRTRERIRRLLALEEKPSLVFHFDPLEFFPLLDTLSSVKRRPRWHRFLGLWY